MREILEIKGLKRGKIYLKIKGYYVLNGIKAEKWERGYRGKSSIERVEFWNRFFL